MKSSSKWYFKIYYFRHFRISWLRILFILIMTVWRIFYSYQLLQFTIKNAIYFVNAYQNTQFIPRSFAKWANFFAIVCRNSRFITAIISKIQNIFWQSFTEICTFLAFIFQNLWFFYAIVFQNSWFFKIREIICWNSKFFQKSLAETWDLIPRT